MKISGYIRKRQALKNNYYAVAAPPDKLTSRVLFTLKIGQKLWRQIFFWTALFRERVYDKKLSFGDANKILFSLFTL